MTASGDSRPTVDVLTLCRPHSRPPEEVASAIAAQHAVNVRHMIAIGWPAASDQNRWQTIARARNQIKQLAQSEWVMFVDDDVVLGQRCIVTLVNALREIPELGAVAADYDGDLANPSRRGHIGMGACLFRREVLSRIEFRSTNCMCECSCCCQDIRRLGYAIEYHALAQAQHLKKSPTSNQDSFTNDKIGGRVLAAFDRRDIARFEHQFLRSLRAWGNLDQVIAVTYGLYPSELQRLKLLPGVEVIGLPNNGVMVPVRRLTDFAWVTSHLPPTMPVAYWDVSDVIFQTSLGPLWREVVRTPDKLLAVQEPKGYPDNGVIVPWSVSIHDPHYRRRALQLLQRHAFLNSGFAAGTAATMARYFAAAARMRGGPELRGTTDWGDQMCLNLYCHQDAERWRRIDDGWNYCVHDCPSGEVHVLPSGIIAHRQRGKIPIAHGNARSLRQFSIRA